MTRLAAGDSLLFALQAQAVRGPCGRKVNCPRAPYLDPNLTRTPMEYRQISDSYSVSGQITPEEIAAVKAAGFRSIICNRPDAEQPGQPSAATVRAAAEA